MSTVDGVIRWSPRKTAWLAAMALPAVLLGAKAVRVDVAIASAALTVLTVCVGHSVGLHRGIIHRTYRMHRITRAVLATLGALAGIAGPLSLLRLHRVRDHWQNQPACPRFYRYEHGVLRDFWWNLHCSHVPREGAPDPEIDDDDARDTVLVFLERWWRPLQLVVAVPAYIAWGSGGVVGCVCVRVTVAIVMHWLVGYFAHVHGYRSFTIDGAREEGRNNVLFGAVSFGEGWHNNHHACPDSARFGRAWWELDIGFLVVRALAAVGLVWAVQTPENTALRPGAVTARSAARRVRSVA